MGAKIWFMWAAASSAIAVALGAFGAHGLKARVGADLLQVWETGARYHMYHALALLGVAAAAKAFPSGLTTASGVCFLLGTVFFSGSLYVMTLTGMRWLGAVTPIGGVLFIAGWVLLGVGAYRQG